MAHFKKPTTLLNNVQAPTDSIAVCNPEYNRWGTIRDVTIECLQGAAGAPTFSITPQQSNDGTHWYDLGAPINALSSNGGPVTVTVTMPYFRIHNPTLSAGGLTVVCS